MNITINGKKVKELRCSRCQRFIVYQNIAAGIVIYQCPRCGLLNEFTFRYLKTEEMENKIRTDYMIENREEVKIENG